MNSLIIHPKETLYVITSAHNFTRSTVDTVYANITCAVNNANDVENNNVVFDLKMVGLDVTANIAVLRFANKCPSEKTAHLAFRKDSHTGDSCSVIGYPDNNNTLTCKSGVVANHAYVDGTGKFIIEQLLTNISFFSGYSGAPILDHHGHVIGIVGYTIAGFCGGCTTRMMKPIVENVIRNIRCTVVTSHNAGQYLSYRKCYLGDGNSWYSCTMDVLTSQYPNTRHKLKTSGFVISGPGLQNPVHGEPVQNGDILLEMTLLTGEYVKLGGGPCQCALGRVLWMYDPLENPLIGVKFVSQAAQNPKVCESVFKFDKTNANESLAFPLFGNDLASSGYNVTMQYNTSGPSTLGGNYGVGSTLFEFELLYADTSCSFMLSLFFSVTESVGDVEIKVTYIDGSNTIILGQYTLQNTIPTIYQLDNTAITTPIGSPGTIKITFDSIQNNNLQIVSYGNNNVTLNVNKNIP